MPVMGQDDAFLHTAECTDLVGHVEHRVASTTLVEDVSDQMFLSVVGGEDADALRRVAQQTHVHEQGYSVLCFCQVLYRNEKKRGSDVIMVWTIETRENGSQKAELRSFTQCCLICLTPLGLAQFNDLFSF